MTSSRLKQNDFLVKAQISVKSRCCRITSLKCKEVHLKKKKKPFLETFNYFLVVIVNCLKYSWKRARDSGEVLCVPRVYISYLYV